MIAITAGRISSLVILVVFAIWLFVSQYLSEREFIKPSVRRISAVDSIDDAIDRSVEMGRGIMFTTGAFSSISGRSANATIAGLQILSYVAGKCAEREVPLKAPVRGGALIPITADVCEGAFKSAGKVFDILGVQYYGATFFSYVLGMYRELDAEPPGAWFSIGAAWDEMNMVPVHLTGKDAFCIAGSSDISYQSAVMMGPDDWLIGEELYAVANYLSGTKEGIGSLMAADWAKVGVLAAIIVGSVLPKVLLDLLAM